MSQNRINQASPKNPIFNQVESLFENAQPTVRVMRLYKPPMHTNATMPSISNGKIASDEGCKFGISSYLLLPDSFGEIFVGEKFSAYIGVINGYSDFNFQQVTLSVRLQTANFTYDLFDHRAVVGQPSGQSKLLSSNEGFDMVVQHVLSELGTHTLRVTVQYMTALSTELKSLRKFYRFNVLQPLQISTNISEINDKIMMQCRVTNITKYPIYLEQVSSLRYTFRIIS
jgi:hypothetical protein